MPPLENARHEEVLKRLTDPDSPTFLNQTKSYAAVYKDANGSANESASRLLANDNVHARYIELMDKRGLDDDSLAKVHSEILHKGEEANRLKALIHANQIKGRGLNAKHHDNQTVYATQININIEPNTNDGKELKK